MKIGNIKGWLDLNQIYLQALQSTDSDIDPASFEFNELDFEKLQFDEDFRAEYLDLMFFIEETCATSQTRTPACERLITTIEKNEYRRLPWIKQRYKSIPASRAIRQRRDAHSCCWQQKKSL